MLRILSLIAATMIAMPLQADETAAARLQAGLHELGVRLALSSEQEAQARSIIEEHLEALAAMLDRHEIDDLGSASTTDIQRMRAVREEFRANRSRTESRLSEVLSEAQMAEFGRIGVEQEAKIREWLLLTRLDAIGAKLKLTQEQASQARPALKWHLEAQMAVLDKHGVANAGSLESGKRPGILALRRLRRELAEVSRTTEERLSGILFETQMAVYQELQEEQRRKLRALLFER